MASINRHTARDIDRPHFSARDINRPHINARDINRPHYTARDISRCACRLIDACHDSITAASLSSSSSSMSVDEKPMVAVADARLPRY